MSVKKIYDAFTFFNELDLLELRLEELNDSVDYFVLVESDHTFSNIPKPYYFEENKDRFAKFLHKIKHVKAVSNKHSNHWQNEFDQRNCILQGCSDANDDDVIIVSDLDEIPRPSVLTSVRLGDNDISALYTPFFYFKFNYMSNDPKLYMPVILAVKKRILVEQGAQLVRSMRDWFMYPEHHHHRNPYMWEVYHHAGWHFGYLGDNDFVKKKMISFSHAEEVAEWVDDFDMEHELHYHPSRVFVKIDEYFPKAMLKKIRKYEKYIVYRDGAPTVKDCLPGT